MQTEGLLKQSQQLAAELQTQQKELQQTNEQLEQKAQQLAEQNVEVERKNQEIEQARRALEDKAAELALTGAALSAADAERLGLVLRVVPAGELAAAAQALAAQLASGAPRALALTKRALAASWDATLEEQLETEADFQGRAGATADHAEGVAAFVERRPPRFTGE